MHSLIFIGLFASIIAGPPALAQDTKSGVDAWERADYATAVAIWRPRALAGDADAQFNLAQAYRMGRGVPADMKQAENWYRRAADQGHLRAADNLGLILFQGGDRAGAMPMIRRSADRGDPRAEFVFATALFNGDYVEKNWPLAYAHMSRAAAAGVPQAANSLSQMEGLLSPGDKEAGLALAREMPRQAGEPVPPRPVAPVFQMPAPQIPAPTRSTAQPMSAPLAPARRTETAIAGGSGWKVQLGAFAKQDGARLLWQQRVSSLPALSGLRPDIVFDGKLARLRTGPFSAKGAAEQICVAVRAAGYPCLIVPPGR